MEDEAGQKKKNILEAIGIETVFIGIITIIIVGILIYLNIIPLPKFFSFKKTPPYPMKGQDLSRAKLLDKNTFVDLGAKDSILSNIKQNYGYDVLWMADNDNVGRTILYDKNVNETAVQLVAGRLNGIGEKFEANNNIPNKIIGSFVKFETIQGSGDMFIILKNPVNNKMLSKVRIVTKKPGTGVLIEDVAYGPKKPIPDYSAEAERFGTISDIPSDKKLLVVGDAVAVITDPSSTKDNYFAAMIVLRRFGGKLNFLSK